MNDRLAFFTDDSLDAKVAVTFTSVLGIPQSYK